MTRAHPMLFSAPMIRALLDGRKTQTRRIIKDRGARPEYCGGRFDNKNDPSNWGWEDYDRGEWITLDQFKTWRFVPIRPGDLIWVKETWRPRSGYSNWDLLIKYAANEQERHLGDGECGEGDWNIPKAAETGNVSPLFMPRWASRITLKVTDVRVLRLWDISNADARAEGIERLNSGRGYYDPTMGKGMVHLGHYFKSPQGAFHALWDSINAKHAPWESNPWVVAYTFTVHQRNVDDMLAATTNSEPRP